MGFRGENGYLPYLPEIEDESLVTAEQVHEIKGATKILEGNPNLYAEESDYRGGKLSYRASDNYRVGNTPVYIVSEQRGGHEYTIGYTLKPLIALKFLQQEESLVA